MVVFLNYIQLSNLNLDMCLNPRDTLQQLVINYLLTWINITNIQFN